MNERLLQYLWNYKVFTHLNFKDLTGNGIEILDFGKWNKDSGPDFLMAKIKINDVILAGNIELHVRSSDWIFHQHSTDPNYENIILHVVFHNDADIEELTKNNIPTLELKDHIDESIFAKHETLLRESKFISCEDLFDPHEIPFRFYEETILKKLEEKCSEFEKDLELYKNDYEAVLFYSLAYSFGLKVNAHLFRQIAESIDFKVFIKICQSRTQLEALLFGISGWLEKPEDEQMKIWKREFDFLKVKFKISDLTIRPKFLRLRPPNFPTIRLSQLADLYHQHQNLFSKIINVQNTDELIDLFKEVKASEYWNNRFNFGKISPVDQPKFLTEDFIKLVILNSILPIKYTYRKYLYDETTDEILSFYKKLSAEKNSIIRGWHNIGLTVKNALYTQSLIYHYKNYCTSKNCLNCSIGLKILKENNHV